MTWKPIDYPALLRRAEEYAGERGITILKIGVLARNTPAHAVYRRACFRDYEVTLIKDQDTQ